LLHSDGDTMPKPIPTPPGQRGIVARHLQQHGSITAAEAYELYGILRLAARICELRRDYDMNIHCVRVVKHIYGRQHERLGKYVLLAGDGSKS
jgi:Helix-turn-helix domain